MSILTDLAAANSRVTDTVRRTLEGQIEGGLKAGATQIRNLLDPVWQ
jgi:hypothetical protein